MPPFESQVYLFSRQPHDSPHTFTNIFSVSSPNQRSLRSRAFVTHSGQDSGTGVWCCNKDPTSNCSHITIARHFLQKLIRVDPAARDDSISNVPLDNTGNVAHCLFGEALTPLLQYLSLVGPPNVNTRCPTQRSHHPSGQHCQPIH